MLSFGERLKIAREKKGMSQVDVYRTIKLNNKSLSRYENNSTAPDPETVKKLIQLYDVSADFIMGLSDDMGTNEPKKTANEKNKLTKCEEDLISDIFELSPESQKKALEYVEMLKTLEEIKDPQNIVDFLRRS